MFDSKKIDDFNACVVVQPPFLWTALLKGIRNTLDKIMSPLREEKITYATGHLISWQHYLYQVQFMHCKKREMLIPIIHIKSSQFYLAEQTLG